MIEKDLGFVLRRYNFRETSLIATLYTSRFGKIRGIFKGFYTSKREFSSTLDIFTLNEFVFYPKRSEIWLVSFADLILDYSFLRETISKARLGALFLNLIDRTMQLWDRNFFVFHLFKDCLYWLNQKEELKTSYIFLIKFLALCGFRPQLNHCLTCEVELKEKAFFNTSLGGLICKNCYGNLNFSHEISKETILSFLYIQETTFPQVLRLALTLNCKKEMDYILREFFLHHLEFDIFPGFPLPAPQEEELLALPPAERVAASKRGVYCG